MSDTVECPVCHELFDDVNGFLEHKRNNDVFTCGVCDIQYHSYNKFQAHKETHNKKLDVHSKQLRPSATNNKKIVYVCKLCSHYSLHEDEMWHHLLVIHGVKPDNNDPEKVMTKLQPMPANSDTKIEAVTLTVPFTDSASFTPKQNKQHTNNVSLVDSETSLANEANNSIIEEAVIVGSKDTAIAAEVTDVDSIIPQPVAPVRRGRGRPKGSFKLKKPSGTTELHPLSEKLVKPSDSIENDQIPAQCKECGKSFSRARQLSRHKCLAADNTYEHDLSALKKEQAPQTTEELFLEMSECDDLPWNEDLERIAEYMSEKSKSPKVSVSIHTSRSAIEGKEGATGSAVTVFKVNVENSNEESSHVGEDDLEVKAVGSNDAEANESNVNFPDRDFTLDEAAIAAKTNFDVPVFDTEEEREAFEKECFGKINYDNVDKLYSSHKFEQNVNEHGKAAERYKDLFVYSCNVCKKIFSAKNSVRIHCVRHLDKQCPFKCSKCDYATNFRGNLYTHMRKHTGNFIKCAACGAKASSKAHMMDHIATHQPGNIDCEICHAKCTTAKSLRSHILRAHNTRKGRDLLSSFRAKNVKGGVFVFHQCEVCKRKFKSRADVERHLSRHSVKTKRSEVCELCNHVAPRRDQLIKHYHSKHRVIYVCCKCGTKLVSATRLMSHLTEHDSDEQVLQELLSNSINCSLYLPERDGTVAIVQVGAGGVYMPIKNTTSDQNVEEANITNDLLALDTIFSECQYKALSLNIFNQLQVTFGELECEYCGRRFHRPLDYNEHVNVHTRQQTFECHYRNCEYSALNKENLRRHTETVHENKVFSCDKCEFQGRTRMLLWHHKRDVHLDPIDKNCTSCGKHFTSLKVLRAHIKKIHPLMDINEKQLLLGMKVHEHGKLGRRTHACTYCDKTFVNKKDLTKHIWLHEGIKPFRCSKCPYQCRSSNNLKVHQMKHTKEKTLLCEDCGKKYKSAGALYWHTKTHEHGKMFKCDRCDYAGSQKSHLKRHMETHSGIRRIKCNECDYTTNTMATMKVHYTRMHKGLTYTQPTFNNTLPPDVDIYKCSTCNYLFCNLSDLKRHINSRHHGSWVEEVQVTEEAVDSSDNVMQVVEVPEHVLEEQNSATSEDAAIGNQGHNIQFVQTIDSSASTPTVNLLQQIVNRVNLRAPKVENDETDMVIDAMEPGTIIVQESDQDLMITDNETGSYIIQYVDETGSIIQAEVSQNDIASVTVDNSQA